MIAGVKEYNQGRTAGKKSGVWDLGSVGNPRVLGPNSVLDVMTTMEAVAFEDSAIGEEPLAPVYALVRFVPFAEENAVVAYVRFEEES